MCDRESTLDVLGEHICCQSVDRIVCNTHDVVIVCEADDRSNWTENFLTHDLHVRLAVGEDRRVQIMARLPNAGASKVESRSFFLASFDVPYDALKSKVNAI